MNHPVATHSPGLPWLSTRHDRALAWCVGLSLLLHLGVLVALPGWHQHLKPAVQTVFSASFAPPPAAVPMTPQPPQPPQPAQPKVKAQPPEPPKPLPRPAPQPMAQPPMPAVPTPSPTATPSASAPPATPVMTASAAVSNASSNAASVNVPAAAAAVAPAVAPAPPSPAAQQPGSASSATTSSANSNEAGSLEQYRLALIGVARKFKRYPTQAMDRGWTGRVDVRLTIGSNGQMQDVVVRRSSGYGTLDNAALDMVRKGAPLTPLPPALRGREVVIDIPVIFDLQAG